MGRVCGSEDQTVEDEEGSQEGRVGRSPEGLRTSVVRTWI